MGSRATIRFPTSASCRHPLATIHRYGEKHWHNSDRVHQTSRLAIATAFPSAQVLKTSGRRCKWRTFRLPRLMLVNVVGPLLPHWDGNSCPVRNTIRVGGLPAKPWAPNSRATPKNQYTVAAWGCTLGEKPRRRPNRLARWPVDDLGQLPPFGAQAEVVLQSAPCTGKRSQLSV